MCNIAKDIVLNCKLPVVNKFVCVLLLFVNCFYQLYSQILPKEGSKLNYRLIGFSFEERKKPGQYILEIARGNDGTESSFKKNIIKTVSVKESKVIAEVPGFGCEYSWRTIYTTSGPDSIKSDFYHFSTGFCPEVDTGRQRLRILQPGVKYKNAYVFLDYSRVMYDMEGNPVWYLPDTNEFFSPPNDLKLSPQATITFVQNNGEAYEINYNGDILWKGPNDGQVNGEKKENYHHQLTRLANGHYMVLGLERAKVLRKWPENTGKEFIIDENNKTEDTNYVKNFFGTIIEYDETGKVVWSWRFLKYFKESDPLLPGRI